MSDKIVKVSDDSFEADVRGASQPVLVDFWAEWCAPCKRLAPVLDDVAESYDGKVTVAKLNIEDNPNTAPKFGIRGIPTLILFKDGEPAGTLVGEKSKAELTAFLDQHV